MRVLLIQPPVEDYYQTAIRTWPLGLACLAAVAEADGHAVTILDAQPPGVRRPTQRPECLAGLDRWYRPGNRSPFKLFGHYTRFGLEEAEIRTRIREAAPDVVGVAALFTPYAEQALACARLAREAVPGVPVVVGGAHATVAPERVLACPDVDWVVLGEGERPFVSLLRHLASGTPAPESIPALGFRTRAGVRLDRRLHLLPRGEDLPVPARHLLDPGAYTIGGRPYTMLQTSRGCPHRCGFCAVRLLSGGAVRRRPVAAVVAEMAECARRWGTRIFDLEDDHFPADRASALEFCEAVSAEPALAGIELAAMNGLPTRPLDREVLAAMRRAGFRHLDLAFVSARPESISGAGRPDPPGHFLEVLEEAAGLDFFTVSYIVIGLPTETPRQTLESILPLLARPGIIGPSVLYVTPGTALADQFPPGDDFTSLRSTAAAAGRPGYTREEQLTLLAIVRFVNYLKSLPEAQGSPRLAALADSLAVRYGLSGAVGGPFGLELPAAEVGRFLAAASLRGGALLAMTRISRKPPRFCVEPEPLDHGLFREFLRLAAATPVAPARRTGTMADRR